MLPLLAIAVVFCVSSVSGAPDNRGTEFIVMFMENYQTSYDLELFITTAKPQKVDVTVTSPKSGSKYKVNEKFTITAGQVKQVKFTNKLRLYGVEKSSKGILIKATDEVSVYGFNKESHSCDGFLGLPVDVLGKEYRAVVWSPPYRKTLIGMVAVEDNTKVKISFPAGKTIDVVYNKKTYKGGSSIDITLSKYDTFQIEDKRDLTGTLISADKKISVFSGNQKTKIGKGGSQDHLVEHLTPTNTWGKSFVTVPTPSRTTGDYFKFIASKDNTKVTITGMTSSKSVTTFTMKKAGDFVQKTIASNRYTKVVSTEPIMVVQFVMSQQSSKEPADPSMMIVPPTEQFGADYTFATPKYSKGSYTNHFMIVIENDKRDGLLLDDKAISTSGYKTIPGTNPTLVSKSVKVSEGTHRVRHKSPIVTFGGYMYGGANAESYGLVTGMRMAKVAEPCKPSKTVVGDGIDNDCDGKIDEEVCTVENKQADDDKDGKKDEDCAIPPPLDGKWSAWGAYGACSKICGGSGTQTRKRTCTNPAPKYDGKACPGLDAESKACTTGPCPVDGGWGNYGNYGSCSKPCGGGVKTRTRKCDKPKPAHGGKTCSGSSTATASCNTQGCPVDGKWGAWGKHSACSKQCGGGTWTRTRSCDSPKPANGGKKCPGLSSETTSCNTSPCPIHGGWGSYGNYGACNKVCGGGVKQATRKCDKPKPAHGGKNCAGSAVMTASCNTHNCPVDGGWGKYGPYGSCSKVCGGGVKQATRKCDSPKPAHGGKKCVGSATTTASCNTHPCPVDGGWGKYGSYGACNKACGGGVRQATRNCDSPKPAHGGKKCTGSPVMTASCNTHNCPVDGGWGKYGQYSACNKVCGGGVKQATRQCDSPKPAHSGKNCVGSAVTTASCNTHPCPVHGGWGKYGSYGACNKACGGGVKQATRKCDSPKPAHGGKQCAGSAVTTATCNTHVCPVDGGWGPYGKFSACTKACGGGTQTRSRSCDSPAPKHGGKKCVGSAVHVAQCNTKPCPGDGGWGTWSAYTKCTKACGGGTWSRSRKCDSPAPVHGGKYCVGSATETTPCNTKGCPVDGGWGQYGNYGACSKACGGGVKQATRKCDKPKPAHGGKKCTGSAVKTATCNTHHCPVDGGWGPYGKFSTCTKACGGGTQTRSRSCDSPAPKHGGKKCVGSAVDVAQCNTKPCPGDGGWGTWSAYSTCSKACGGGTWSRSRKCDSPAPVHGGKDCVGSATETTPCNTKGCPVNGGFSAWTKWNQCDKACGNGQQNRTRACDSPAPQHGGQKCVGNDLETKPCKLQDCVVPCASGEVKCADGKCVKGGQNDGVRDCADGSDEPPGTCAAGEVKCDDGNCATGAENDGYRDCADGSDEPAGTCARGEVKCGDGQCVTGAKDDGNKDCADGSDETSSSSSGGSTGQQNGQQSDPLAALMGAQSSADSIQGCFLMVVAFVLVQRIMAF